MVYLICFTCDATLKKPQLIKHMQGRCAYGNYSCIDCKQTFDCEAVKNHTSCKSEQELTHGQFFQQKKVKKEKVEWLGWKKAIRKTLKSKPNNTEKISKIREEVIKQYVEAGVGLNLVAAKKIFQQKILNKKFNIDGETISYTKQ